MVMLKPFYTEGIAEAGCDEAGRGCLAGPVYAAAVILTDHERWKVLDDSKKLPVSKRDLLRREIETHALAFAVASADAEEIDRHNILRASIMAMHRALAKLQPVPDAILVDGNRFISYAEIPHRCIVGGDGLFYSIAAASVLAKTYRDEHMVRLAREYPGYGWEDNKGYPTRAHREAIIKLGVTPFHRRSFRLNGKQLEINFHSERRRKMKKDHL